MAIQRKSFFSTSDHAQMLIRVCTENALFRQRLISLLSLPFEDSRQIISAWLDSMREDNSKAELIKALEFIEDEERAAAILQELEKIDA